MSQLQFITQEATLLGLFVTAGIILVGRDWRRLILALLAQYILVGLILSRLVRPDIATLEVMIGAFICPILFLSARQVSFGSFSIALSMSRTEAAGRSPKANWWRNLYLVVAWAKVKIATALRRPPARFLDLLPYY